MIQWIKETFFHDDDVEHLLDANIRMQAQMKARQEAYDSEIGFYKRELYRLHGELGQLVKLLEVRK
jgi:hypothetical protein